MVEQIVKQEEVEENTEEGVTVCGENLTSPVVDEAYYIDEISYRIGNRKYIEHAP